MAFFQLITNDIALAKKDRKKRTKEQKNKQTKKTVLIVSLCYIVYYQNHPILYKCQVREFQA